MCGLRVCRAGKGVRPTAMGREAMVNRRWQGDVSGLSFRELALAKVSHPLLERYVSALILVSKMAPTEAGKAARVPGTQSHCHSRCRRTTSREEDGRKPRRECQEGSHPSGPHPLRHRKWGPHPLTSEAGRERCWGTGVSEGDRGARRACLRRGRKEAQVLAWGPPKISPLVD